MTAVVSGVDNSWLKFNVWYNTRMSEMFKINLQDFTKGLVTAVLSAVLLVIYEALQNGGLEAVDWKLVQQVAVMSGLGYVLKNYFSDSAGKFGGVV